MRLVICGIGVLVTSFALTGCGQSGALQLAKDQNYDKRAKYLIYSDSELKEQKKEQVEVPVQQQFAAPSNSDTQTP
ncbi:lipoprotein [Acinetobacter portensis]|uniref:Lipoprotein n=2 Tax=Acinetobacter TaxID=469 RepID=A0A6L6GHJ2_9GAMM|nr:MULTISPECIES: lipoprotein [Acinetobacter]MBP8063554.1 lipoprotein [Acinetobacter sp.]MCK7609567.1 lipoprotein [Acinetobacter portensis]MCK7640343.1 lipoprotein [Acinetobacter portensis]MDY6458822.1 lipoprotein [Acinetobacter faecalis]MDY6462757.1 lipoprotein [Acinetobacter faecalis]